MLPTQGLADRLSLGALPSGTQRTVIAEILAAAIRFSADVPTPVVAKWINDRIDIPVFNEEQEQKILENAIQTARDLLRELLGA